MREEEPSSSEGPALLGSANRQCWKTRGAHAVWRVVFVRSPGVNVGQAIEGWSNAPVEMSVNSRSPRNGRRASGGVSRPDRAADVTRSTTVTDWQRPADQSGDGLADGRGELRVAPVRTNLPR